MLEYYMLKPSKTIDEGQVKLSYLQKQNNIKHLSKVGGISGRHFYSQVRKGDSFLRRGGDKIMEVYSNSSKT